MMRREFIQGIFNLFPGVALQEFKVGFPAQNQAPIMVGPCAVPASRQSPLIALSSILQPIAVFVFVIAWTVVLTHQIPPGFTACCAPALASRAV